jgi:hypothetical protein
MSECKTWLIDIVCLAQVDNLSSYGNRYTHTYVTKRRVGCHFFKWMSAPMLFFINLDERLCFIMITVNR